ncbi:MAG: rod shape-determining protein MreC [Ruminococcus sp.]|nr:rod shape-determining protein MreC [Ruminococcus sp.]
MKEFFRSIKFKVILCIIFLLVGMGVYTLTNEGRAFLVSQGVYTLFEPILSVTSSISDSISANVDAILNSKEYYNENQELKQEIYDLNEQLANYESDKKELEELRKFVGIKEDNPSYILSASCNIISKTSSDPYCTFTIDKGTEDGISLYDPVVTGSGLVGMISEVADSYSVVTTILSPDISVGAMSVKSTDMGIIQGTATESINQLTKMMYVDKENTISVGDTIVCSGNSGIFPEGYLIGTVKEVGIEETGLSAYAIVEPFVSIDKLTSVRVITDFEGQGIGNNS